MFENIMLGFAALDQTILLVSKLIETAKQSGELTPEQEAAIDSRQKELMAQDHWKVEPNPTTQSTG